MSIIYRSVATTASSTTNPLTVAIPAGAAAGDLALLSIALNTSGSTVDAVPSGFTLVEEIATGNSHIHVYKKTVTGSEPANYSVTHSSAGTPRMALGVVCWRTDAAKTLAIDSHDKQSNSASTNRVFPSLTTTHAATALNCFAVKLAGTNDSPDAAMTERWDFDIFVPHYLMTQSLSSAGATGTRTSTGTSAASQCISIAICELDPPSDPSALAASPISTTQIDLAWVDNSSNELNFELERSADGVTGWSLINSPAANATSYSNTGLSEHVQYFYRIRAVNPDGNSAYSSVADTYTLIAPPTGLTATAVSSSQINLAWTDNSSAESGYQVEQSNNGTTGWSLIHTTAANVSSYNVTGLPANTQRFFRVRAYAGGEFSTYTSVANDTTFEAISAPTGLMATALGLRRIELNFTDPNANELGVQVERSLTGVGAWVLITTLAPNVTTFVDTGLEVATTYYYRVRAFIA